MVEVYRCRQARGRRGTNGMVEFFVDAFALFECGTTALDAGAAVERAGLSMSKHRIYSMSVAKVYPHYVAKAERKGRAKSEVDEIIRWLTGYSQEELEAHLEKETDFESFFGEAPRLNPARRLIKGVVCGVRVEEIEEPLMKEIRCLDKLVDELARGKAMEKILRG